MEWINPIAMLVTCVLLPYVVNLFKKADWSTNVKRWLAVSLSVLAGLCAGLISGAPTPETLVTWILAVIGGTQLAYSAFKSIGVTSNWLDALEGIGSPKIESSKTE